MIVKESTKPTFFTAVKTNLTVPFPKYGTPFDSKSFFVFKSKRYNKMARNAENIMNITKIPILKKRDISCTALCYSALTVDEEYNSRDLL